MDLKLVVSRLEEYAPLKTATDWDNVGLLVEPTEPLEVKKVLITNDLTEPVLEEAISKNVNLIISYHPAIFKALKRLTQVEWKQRSIVKCIEKRIAVFSPHTTWDSVDNGINDWILQVFNTKKVESVKETKNWQHPCGYEKNLKITVSSRTIIDKLLNNLTSLTESIKFIGEKEISGLGTEKQIELEFLSSAKGVVAFIETLNSIDDSKQYLLSTLRIHELDKPLLKNIGLGRIGYLNEPIKIREIVQKMKDLLQMKTFRLALANGKSLDDTVNTIAVGAGSGSTTINNQNADFIITGEFTHHEILHEVHRGVSLIVTDHSNTERGHQVFFRERFIELLKKYNEHEKLEILISEVDRDPLEYV